jgi:hypothetical protein
MLWGLGTGRCGTKSLAADLGGLHEPEPWLGAESVPAHYGDEAAYRVCRDVLQSRLALGAPAVVDLHQSWLIPLICQVDAQAEFVWVIRDPAGCVASLLASGAWTTPSKWPTLWHPWEGWPEGVSRFDKALGYWAEVNLIIGSALAVCGRPWQSRRTADLQAHENRQPASAEWVFSAEEHKRLALWHEVLYEGPYGG